ncbi:MULTISPECIES: DUF5677 domain-containing protein [Rhizobium/Agrobacterium group]|uniref:Uncharacterized protein n=1 Tax=Allorhizobium terrae TaxID=1848972 RepID=A0A4S3ZWP1_9HYPH|nr:DUF5677 domain-containing protein [Allorhizobium terrae]THF50237.1 hypothetical protein E6C51_10865 [Allorhizobium terrae]
MTEDENGTSDFKGKTTQVDYLERLRRFDAAVCEMIAVSQATAGRQESPAIGYSTHVFARMCSHARSLVSSAPMSRWVKRDFETWDVSTVASHARSLLEGYVLFYYLSSAPDDAEVQRAYVNVMHLYDCLKRIKILPFVLSNEEIEWFKGQAEEIKQRLESIKYFSDLDSKIKSDILAGKYMMITPQKDVIRAAGIDQQEYDFYWNYLSQYTHILSFTFYRMEPNGRGTGVENGFDRDALCMVLEFFSGILTVATDRMIELFPDAGWARKGKDSKFSPGPMHNLPKEAKKVRKSQRRR